jgi:hypothetical protein
MDHRPIDQPDDQSAIHTGMSVNVRTSTARMSHPSERNRQESSLDSFAELALRGEVHWPNSSHRFS